MTEITVRMWESLLGQATEIGTKQGTNAAEWWCQYNVDNRDDDVTRAVLTAIDDVDSEVLDSFPSPPTGEWADDYSPRDLYREIGMSEQDESDDMQVWHTYADAFSDAVQAEIGRKCRTVLGEMN